MMCVNMWTLCIQSFKKILYTYAVSNENRDSMLNSLLKMKDVIKHAPNTYGGAMQSEKL